jgi:hypothetical protein
MLQMHGFLTISFLTLILGLKIWMNQVCSEMYMLAMWCLVLLITKASLKYFVRLVGSCDLYSMHFITSGLIDNY